MVDLRFLLFLFLRRSHWFVLVAVPVAVLGVALAFTLPPVYRAEARLLVESPQIPGDLAASTVRTGAPEMLRVIEQRLLTRVNLLEIARRFNVHAAEPDLSADRIVADMRERITLRLPGAFDVASFVTISFAAPDPTMSAQVTNELVTQILAENVALRTAATGQTLAFFEQEVAELSDQMSRQGAKILEFKLANKDALPDSLEYRRTRQASQQERLLQVERELASLRDRRTRLTELYERTGRVATDGAEVSPELRQLQQLRNELATALVIYAPESQRIRTMRALIAALEQEVEVQTGADGATAASDGLTAYELQLGDIDGQMTFLADQKGLIEAELAALAETIDQTPANSVQLGLLERDYDNLRLQYTQETARLAEARTGDRIEAQSRGQRMTVIEQAIVPAAPASPNRKLVAAAGLGGGMGMGLALVVLLELLGGGIHRLADLTAQTGLPGFGAIPYIRTRRQMFWRRAAISAVVLAVLAGVPAALYVVDANYMPMDMLLDRVVERSGLGPLLAQLRQGFAG